MLAIVFFVFVVTGLAPTCKSRSLLHKSPEDTLKAFFGAANEGKYSEAESYLTTSSRTMIGLAGGIKSVVDDDTKGGMIDHVEIKTVESRGEGAKTYYTI